MTYSASEEQKRYLRSFILLTLIAAAGILAGLYLYEYTGFFSAYKEGDSLSYSSEFDMSELMLMFLDEAHIPALIFMFGFTLFAPYTAAAIILYKGFMTGFSVLYFGMVYRDGQVNKLRFTVICIALGAMLLLYIIAGAKSQSFSGSLRYAAPDLISLLRRKETVRYIITFLLIFAFILGITTLKYTIPILNT